MKWEEGSQLSHAQHLEQILRPTIEALGFDLWGVELLRQGRYSILRVYIDAQAGIQLADCEAVSRHISGVLDVEDPIQGPYSLEVSSPGTDRQLFHLPQYEKYGGQNVHVRLRQPIEGRRKLTGTLIGVEDQYVLLKEADKTWQLPYVQIDKANIEPVLDNTKGKPKKKG